MGLTDFAHTMEYTYAKGGEILIFEDLFYKRLTKLRYVQYHTVHIGNIQVKSVIYA